MTTITYKDRPLHLLPGETVLEAVLRAGIDAASSCRAGQCQTCLHRAVEGKPPASSQEGLTEQQKALGYFLPCVCVPTEPLIITPPDDLGAKREAVLRSIEKLTLDVLRVRLEVENFSYRPGQFLQLIAGEDLSRNYSLASHPEEDPFLEMHIRIHPNGRMSGHLSSELKPGHRFHIAGPSGTCFYQGVDKDQPMALIGAGTGLAPLYGVLRDALRQGHRGPIRLYHGARDSSGLYLSETLQALARSRDNVSYIPVALSAEAPNGGDIAALALDEETSLAAQTAFFLCGGKNLVQRLKQDLFMAGASLKAIRSDTFLPAG
jgi:CDP-4-dehydro-6-deoxyglucose reductase, E3